MIKEQPRYPLPPSGGRLRHVPVLMLLAGLLRLATAAPPLGASELIDVYLVSTYDSLTVRSIVMVPTDYDSLTPTPVLFTFHGAMSSNGYDILQRYEPSADPRGWIIGSPSMHGENIETGEDSFGARAAQHDVIDLLNYLREHYNVDEERLYLSGASMGGQMTSVMAVKYPHVFAAAVPMMGPSDLPKMYDAMVKQDRKWIWQGVELECGGTPDEVPYEYERRSPWISAMNLKYVPFAIGHGTNDPVIDPRHATWLARSIEAYDPLWFNGIWWHNDGHELMPEHVEWACSFLEGYSRPAWPEDLFLQVDESKDYYYADIVQADTEAWTTLDVDVAPPDSLVAIVTNIADMTIHADQTSLDPALDMALTLDHDGLGTFTVAGLVDSLNYTLFQGGLEYTGYTYGAGVLTITLPDSLPSPISFQVIAGP